PAEAVETYRHYLREAPDAADRADIEQRLARLAPAAPAPAAPGTDGNETPGELGGQPPAAPRLGPTPPGGPATRAADPEPGPRTEDEGSGWNAYNMTAWIATAATAALLGTAGFLAASASSKKSDVDRLILFRDEHTQAPLQYSQVAKQYESA